MNELVTSLRRRLEENGGNNLSVAILAGAGMGVLILLGLYLHDRQTLGLFGALVFIGIFAGAGASVLLRMISWFVSRPVSVDEKRLWDPRWHYCWRPAEPQPNARAGGRPWMVHFHRVRRRGRSLVPAMLEFAFEDYLKIHDPDEALELIHLHWNNVLRRKSTVQ